jgi:hypothetical protein
MEVKLKNVTSDGDTKVGTNGNTKNNIGWYYMQHFLYFYLDSLFLPLTSLLHENDQHKHYINDWHKFSKSY